MFLKGRLQRARVCMYWMLAIAVMPRLAVLATRLEWDATQYVVREVLYYKPLPHVIALATCAQCTLWFPGLLTVRALDALHVAFYFLALLLLPQFRELAQDKAWYTGRLFVTCALGNARLTAFLEIVTIVVLTVFESMSQDNYATSPCADPLGVYYAPPVIVFTGVLLERLWLRETASVLDAISEKDIRDRFLAILVDGAVTVQRDKSGIVRVSAVNEPAKHLFGCSSDVGSMVGEPLERFAANPVDLSTMVAEAEQATDSPALLRAVSIRTLYGEHTDTNAFFVGTPFGTTIAFQVVEKRGDAYNNILPHDFPNSADHAFSGRRLVPALGGQRGEHASSIDSSASLEYSSSVESERVLTHSGTGVVENSSGSAAKVCLNADAESYVSAGKLSFHSMQTNSMKGNHIGKNYSEQKLLQFDEVVRQVSNLVPPETEAGPSQSEAPRTTFATL